MVHEGSTTPVEGGETELPGDETGVVSAGPSGAVPDAGTGAASAASEAGGGLGQTLARIAVGAGLVFVSGGLALFHFFGWYGVAGAAGVAVAGGAALASVTRSKPGQRSAASARSARKAAKAAASRTTGLAGRAGSGPRLGGKAGGGRKLLGSRGSKGGGGKGTTTAASRMPGLPKLGNRKADTAGTGTGRKGTTGGGGKARGSGAGTPPGRRSLRNPFGGGKTTRASKGSTGSASGTPGRAKRAAKKARAIAALPLAAGTGAWRGGKKLASKTGAGARRTGRGVKAGWGKTAALRSGARAGGKSALAASRAGGPIKALKSAWASSRGKHKFGKTIGTAAVLIGALLIAAGRPLWKVTGRPVGRYLRARWTTARTAIARRAQDLRAKLSKTPPLQLAPIPAAAPVSPALPPVPPAKFQEPITVPTGTKPRYKKENPMFTEDSNIDEDSGMLAIREQMGKDADAAEEGLARAKRWQEIVENGPFNQDVKDAAEDQVNMFTMSCEGMSELVRVFDVSHAEDLARLGDPRTNEQLWDHSLNQD